MSALRTHPQKWLDDLLDKNSEWVELTPSLNKTLEESLYKAGDEAITGFGFVEGKRVGIIAHNNLSHNGYITSRGSEKILKLMDSCEESGCPIISLMSSPGVSIHEGLLAGDGYAKILRRTCELSGIIPQITGIMGVCVGGPAYSATLQDIVVFNRLRSHMMVSAPNVVKSVLGQNVTLGELGGSKTHSEITGLAHFVEENVKNQILRIRALIRFLPSHYLENPVVTSSQNPNTKFDLPEDLNVPYSMKEFLNSVMDASYTHEYLPNYGNSVMTIWGYIGGQPIGVLASNPEFLAGSLNVESSEKSARFIRLCDAYNIPLVTFVDTPGFMPGSAEEHRGLLKSGSRLCRAMQTKVPRLSVVLRKNYGAAAIVLTQTEGWGGDLVLTLEKSSCAVMGFEAAQQAIYGVTDFSKEELEKLKSEYQKNYESPQIAYEKGFIDEILTSENLREKLISHLKVLQLKRDKKQSPVRGIEP